MAADRAAGRVVLLGPQPEPCEVPAYWSKESLVEARGLGTKDEMNRSEFGHMDDYFCANFAAYGELVREYRASRTTIPLNEWNPPPHTKLTNQHLRLRASICRNVVRYKRATYNGINHPRKVRSFSEPR